MKRCVCGHSTRFPLCDGSHQSDGWACKAETERSVPLAFVASSNLVNLADRLAHRFGGTSLVEPGERVSAKRLVALTDGHDVAELHQRCDRAVSSERTLIAVGIDPAVALWAFEGWETLHIEEEDPSLLWRAVEAAVEGTPPAHSSTEPPPRVFLSHSVRDEGALFGVVETLRESFGVPVFVCADSIAPGTRWHEEILGELKRCDVFLFVGSTHANASVFCAFEAGFALALGKAIHLISLDGAPPPAHLDDLQAIDLARLQARKPWLDAREVLLDACLHALRR